MLALAVHAVNHGITTSCIYFQVKRGAPASARCLPCFGKALAGVCDILVVPSGAMCGHLSTFPRNLSTNRRPLADTLRLQWYLLYLRLDNSPLPDIVVPT